MPEERVSGSRLVASVTKATRVLDALADAGEPLGTLELARQTAINASTISRVLATLAAAGYVEQLEAGGRWRLGLRLARLGALARADLRAPARPILERLVDELGETATLSLPGDGAAITVDFVPSRASVASAAQIGRPSLLHATAVGKVVLAFARSARLPSGQLEAFTARTITDRDRLAREVERTRSDGVASAAGEREPELNAVASPILDAHGDLVGILGVQGPASRLHGSVLDAAAEAVRAAAADLSRALGANR